MAAHDPKLTNEDLEPTTDEQRTWGSWHIAALWIGMAICIPTYGLAAGLVAGGWSLKVAVFSIAFGNLIVLIPLVLNGHPGTKYGIPFPVLLRSSFGIFGSNVPAMIRALVACGWFGIQTWIGGKALWVLLTALFPDVSTVDVLPDFVGITTGQLLCFLAFWLLNVVIIMRGMETLKVLESLAAPFLLVIGVALFVWAWHGVSEMGGDLGTMLADPVPPTKSGWSAIGIGITVAVAFWGTLALNIPDFSRFAKSQRDQMVGQAIGLPATMGLFVFIGAAVTNATMIMFGERISDPVLVLAKIGSPVVTVIAMLALVLATLSTNLAANIVSPANDFSNLAPSKINFRRGALIAATIGALIMPWKMWENSAAYVSTWLLGCGALLGSVGGIMIADYFLLRKTQLVVDDLYRRGGAYEYTRGFNPVALCALLIGILPNLPGFLGAIGVVEAGEGFTKVYEWAWFVAFGLAGASYLIGMKLFGPRGN